VDDFQITCNSEFVNAEFWGFAVKMFSDKFGFQTVTYNGQEVTQQ